MRGFKLRRVAVRVVVVACIFAAGAIAGFYSHRPIQRWHWQRLEAALDERFLRNPAPEISTTTLQGDSWRLSDQLGRVVVLYFWASWCGPCESETPYLKELHAAYGEREDFILVGISLDEDPVDLQRDLEESGASWLQLHEPGLGWRSPVVRAYGLRGIPSLWLVDANGQIVSRNLRLGRTREAVEDALGIKESRQNG